jgi:phosphate transport system substrate-binding protein
MRWPCLLLATTLLFGACKPQGEPVRGSAAGSALKIQGAGATFPYPLYAKWIAVYGSIDPKVQIDYQSIGSGGGVRQITERTVDFGASDAPMNDAELAKAPGKLLHIPMTLGAVVVTYNLPSLSKPLALSAETVVGIFDGTIKTWNDPKIAATNPEVPLPKDPITVIYRSDGSGTTAVFTEYLAAVSASWKSAVGAGKSVKFPTGLGAKGNEGVTGQVRQSPNSIGYVELAYAEQNKLPAAAIQNRGGKLVAPSIGGIRAAAASVAVAMPDDLRVSIVNSEGDAAYPIAAFTYILVYEEQPDPLKGKALAQFLWWATHDGQRFAAPLSYAPLPDTVTSKVEAKLRTLRSGGAPLLPGEAAAAR